VVLDVEIATGEINERQVVLERIDAAAETTGAPNRTVTADAGTPMPRSTEAWSGARSRR
jgi:hypothetical protein